MIGGIFLYYLWILVSFLGFYILLRCTYEDSKYTKKVKFPIIAYFGAFLVSVIPVFNIIAGAGVFVYLFINYYDGEYYYKIFLFKEF